MQSSSLDFDELLNKEEYKSFEHMCICSICNGILTDPMQCGKCENCFCNVCITQWSQKSTKCPFNCENATLQASKTMKKLLSKMLFQCPNGCEEKVPYLDYSNHQFNFCPKINLKERYDQLLVELNELKAENSLLKKSAYKMPDGHVSIFIFKSKHHLHGLMSCKTTKPVAHCQNCQKIIFPTEGGYYCSFCDYDYCYECQRKEYAITSSNINMV